MADLSGTRGCWSEAYVLLKLLSDGRLHAADEGLNKEFDVYYEILEIIRDDGHGKVVYVLDNDNEEVRIEAEGGEIVRISSTVFRDEASYMLGQICKKRGGGITILRSSEFLRRIRCEKLKAGSKEKTDITIKLHDYHTASEQVQGFSIKSLLGAQPTLLNASKVTNFNFSIQGDFDDFDMDEINSLFRGKSRDMRGRVRRISDMGCRLKFSGLDNDIFRCNLILIDSQLPDILSEMLIRYYSGEGASVLNLIENVTDANPLGYEFDYGHQYYKVKLKKFLADVATGMVPGTTWTGEADSTGGYIIVREDGEVVCYHLFNRNVFEDYLLRGVEFETPSTTKHEFGDVEKIGGEYVLKLNLQIRFIIKKKHRYSDELIMGLDSFTSRR